MDSEIFWVNELWKEQGKPEAWNFFISDLHNGDLFLFLSLLKPFHKIRGRGKPIRLITSKEAHCQLAFLFSDVIDETVHVAGAKFSGRQVRDWRRAMGHAHLQPGTLINLYPPDYFPELEWGALWYLFNDHCIFFVHLFKFLLGLPLDIAPSPPLVSDSASEAARALFDELGLPASKTLILWPVAYSDPFAQDRRRVRDHFAALAARAVDAGFTVCTSVAPSDPEREIIGTRRIFVPFNLMIPFAELAGNAMILRTGISEVLSWAKCRKINIYPAQRWVDVASPLTYGLGGSNSNLAFDFIHSPDPERFAETALSELVRVNDTPANFIPGGIRELLRVPVIESQSRGEFRHADLVIRHDYCRVFTNGVLAEGWCGAEDWGVWTNGYRSVLYVRPAIRSHSSESEYADRQVFLVLDLTFALHPQLHEVLRYSVEINTDTTYYEARWPNCWQTLRIPLSPEVCHGPIRVTFVIENPESSRMLSEGRADDDRVIGVGLQRATYEVESLPNNARKVGMYEQSKAAKRRFCDGAFLTRYFVGSGIDVGAGPDGLSRYRKVFPLISDVRDWDQVDGDAQHLRGIADASHDFLHSSHTLEHMIDPRQALANWIRVVRPGGYLVITVPDEDMYERGRWPSINPDHKVTFTVYKTESWSPVSVNLIDLVREFSADVELERLNVVRDFFQPEVEGDQTMGPNAECAIEIVLRRR